LFYKYKWPGNVRELRNLIERIAILGADNTEKVSSIIKESLKKSSGENYKIENTNRAVGTRISYNLYKKYGRL